jgi:hypothetical protein
MSLRKSLLPVAAVGTALAVRAMLSPVPLVAQQDSAMMSHESSRSHEESGMMSHDTGMMKHDTGMMKHDAGVDGGEMMFMGAEGQKASGDYEIVESGGKRVLNLKPSFAVAAAPDLYLVLAHGPAPDAGALYLGKLRNATGAQTVDLPKDKDLTGYSTLLVWSKKDKRAVATAKWHAPSGKTMDRM